eukprot:SAG11_NODE_19179_length_472_cov_1.241287_1_plen_40_part_10
MRAGIRCVNHILLNSKGFAVDAISFRILQALHEGLDSVIH